MLSKCHCYDRLKKNKVARLLACGQLALTFLIASYLITLMF